MWAAWHARVAHMCLIWAGYRRVGLDDKVTVRRAIRSEPWVFKYRRWSASKRDLDDLLDIPRNPRYVGEDLPIGSGVDSGAKLLTE